MSQQMDFDPKVDYYKAIGVAKDATADEIKKAYRKLAKANHPDSTGGDKAKESRFKDISNAYDVLGDAKKRALYDQIRAQGGGMPRGFGGGGGVYTSQGPGPGVFDLGDLFRVFQGGGRWGGSAPADFDDEGPTVRQRAGGRRRPAPAEEAEPEQKVKASDGSALDAKGADVYSDVRISFDRAMLGTIATVPTIAGKAEVKVPPGTSSGKKLRLRGKGITDRAGRTGDHYITVQIDVPGHLDEDQKKQLIQFVTRLRKREQND